MANSNPPSVLRDAEAVACEEAFRALPGYDTGSPRATVLPIDDAVAASLNEPSARTHMEARLLTVLKETGSAVAKEYICSKLAIVGTKAAVPALAALLGEPGLATAARNALERIPGTAPSSALRKVLPRLTGSTRLGVIQSLGVRRDAASARLLAAFLENPDPQLAGAAAAALGEIGSARAARALRGFFSKAPATLKPEVANAMLVCADRLVEQGLSAETEQILRPLTDPGSSTQVVQAAARALSRLPKRP